MRIIFCCLSLLLVSGCAVPLKSAEMQPQFDFYDQLEKNKYTDNISIRDVSVEKGVGGANSVTPEEFSLALLSTLRQARLYDTEDRAKYYLNADVLDIDLPSFGFTFTATSQTTYTLRKAKDDSVVFQETLSVPCSKGISDAFDANRRLRMVTACSVGENLTHFTKLISME